MLQPVQWNFDLPRHLWLGHGAAPALTSRHNLATGTRRSGPGLRSIAAVLSLGPLDDVQSQESETPP